MQGKETREGKQDLKKLTQTGKARLNLGLILQCGDDFILVHI
jgi:hypothetical protein